MTGINENIKTGFNIRPATPNDLETVVSWMKQFFSESPEYSGLFPDQQRTLIYLFNAMLKEDMLLLVSEQEKVLTGVLIAELQQPWYTTDIIAVETAFFILPKYRGKQLARDMVIWYIKWAIAKQAVKARIGSTTGNELEKIQNLYESMGFDLVGYNFSKGL